jgi:hypothetical protein
MYTSLFFGGYPIRDTSHDSNPMKHERWKIWNLYAAGAFTYSKTTYDRNMIQIQVVLGGPKTWLKMWNLFNEKAGDEIQVESLLNGNLEFWRFRSNIHGFSSQCWHSKWANATDSFSNKLGWMSSQSCTIPIAVFAADNVCLLNWLRLMKSGQRLQVLDRLCNSSHHVFADTPSGRKTIHQDEMVIHSDEVHHQHHYS